MEAIEFPWPARSSQASGDARQGDLCQLFRQLAEDDLARMTDLYDGWSDELYAFAVWVSRDRQAAADIVQEVFLELWRLRRRLHRVRKPRPYLFRMVRNAAADRYRRRAGGEETLDEALLEPTRVDPTRTLAAQRASRALADLPETQRTAIYLRLYSELTFREIGEVTGVSLHTAASRYRLAIERLRERLGEGS